MFYSGSHLNSTQTERQIEMQRMGKLSKIKSSSFRHAQIHKHKTETEKSVFSCSVKTVCKQLRSPVILVDNH